MSANSQEAERLYMLLNEKAAELEQTNRYLGGTAAVMRDAARRLK